MPRRRARRLPARAGDLRPAGRHGGSRDRGRVAQGRRPPRGDGDPARAGGVGRGRRARPRRVRARGRSAASRRSSSSERARPPLGRGAASSEAGRGQGADDEGARPLLRGDRRAERLVLHEGQPRRDRGPAPVHQHLQRASRPARSASASSRSSRRSSAGSATTAQVLQIRPHLRHCNACRATVRELHVSRLRRASLFSPIFALTSLKHEIAALFHRAQASDLATGTGLASAGGGGRVATVGAVLGLCLGGAGVGTVCVVNGGLPDFGGDKPARVHAKHDRGPARSAHAKRLPRRREPPVVTKAALSSAAETAPAPKPKASTARARRRQAKKEAAPREFGFENQAPAASTAEPSATTAIPTPTDADQDGVQVVQPRRAGVLAVMSRLKAVLTALFYCVVASTTLRVLSFPVALCVLFVVPSTTHAEERAVGTYAVANCWSDREGRSVSAFTDHYFAPQGHENQVRLRPNGNGAPRHGHAEHPRASAASWPVRRPRSASSRRLARRCSSSRGTLGSGVWTAATRCRRGRRFPGARRSRSSTPRPTATARAAGVRRSPRPSETKRSIPGAMAIKQRIQCMGKGKQNWCSAKSANYIQHSRGRSSPQGRTGTGRADPRRHAAGRRRVGPG